MNKLVRIFHTLKYLKLIQLYFQIRSRIYPKKHFEQLSNRKSFAPKLLTITKSNINYSSYLLSKSNFTFLNINHEFKNPIDWNFEKHGKLWTYNLTYFDFLNQENIDKEYAFELILDFIKNVDKIRDGNEAYPISLRCINWIKFVSNNNIANKKIDKALYSQYYYLIKNIEYHLLGNHLLENGFSLLFGAYYFQNQYFYTKAKSNLQNQLDEQILNDGGHFELSPMYHKILLFRLLDSINLIKNNPWGKDNLLTFLKGKAQLMLGWLETMTYSNDQTANINDSANGIAPSTHDLLNYAKTLDVTWNPQKLIDSGYRIFKINNLELLIDIGNIGPDYIPGHAHADTFNFELIVNGLPIVSDTGISTYEKSEIRQEERSTMAHNTVAVNRENSSDVWGGFRVGKRAKVIKLEEKNNFVLASHSGYKHLGIIHTRSFDLRSIDKIIIKDKLSKENNATAYLHLHPNVQITSEEDYSVLLDKSILIEFSEIISLKKYNFALGFNKKKMAFCIEINFTKDLETIITLLN